MRFACACVAVVMSGLLPQLPARGEEAKLDTARIEQLTGAKGKLDEKEGVFKVSVPCCGPVTRTGVSGSASLSVSLLRMPTFVW